MGCGNKFGNLQPFVSSIFSTQKSYNIIPSDYLTLEIIIKVILYLLNIEPPDMSSVCPTGSPGQTQYYPVVLDSARRTSPLASFFCQPVFSEKDISHSENWSEWSMARTTSIITAVRDKLAYLNLLPRSHFVTFCWQSISIDHERQGKFHVVMGDHPS